MSVDIGNRIHVLLQARHGEIFKDCKILLSQICLSCAPFSINGVQRGVNPNEGKLPRVFWIVLLHRCATSGTAVEARMFLLERQAVCNKAQLGVVPGAVH